MANPYQVSPPPAPRRRSGGNLVGFLVLALIIAGIYGASQWLGKDADGKNPTASTSASPKASDPGSPESSSDTSSSWKVGDCGGPDPDNKPDGYRPQGCSASGATFKAIDIKDASILPGSIQCPPGTDLMIEVSISYGGKKGGGLPTNTVCGRNLSADHPGDPGAGGGQLVKGDCVTDQAQEVACASGGAKSSKVLGLVKQKSECPAGTTDPIQLTMAIGRPFDVICTDG
uniref:Septum formation-related domain-containing protein n=1 Tax=Streptomyces sp. NBC_00049 TaxID=2903617 RepID=A0AAU2JT30_9ACTN